MAGEDPVSFLSLWTDHGNTFNPSWKDTLHPYISSKRSCYSKELLRAFHSGWVMEVMTSLFTTPHPASLL